MNTHEYARERSKSTQKESRSRAANEAIFESVKQNTLNQSVTQSGKIQHMAKPVINQSEAVTNAMKSLQERIRETAKENESLKGKLKIGIEEMKKFENRFKIEKEKWQKHLIEELKHSSENETNMKKTLDKLIAENTKLYQIIDEDRVRQNNHQKETAMHNERAIKCNNTIEDLQKKCIELEKTNTLISKQLNEEKSNAHNILQTYESKINESTNENNTVVEQMQQHIQQLNEKLNKVIASSESAGILTFAC